MQCIPFFEAAEILRDRPGFIQGALFNDLK